MGCDNRSLHYFSVSNTCNKYSSFKRGNKRVLKFYNVVEQWNFHYAVILGKPLFQSEQLIKNERSAKIVSHIITLLFS